MSFFFDLFKAFGFGFMAFFLLPLVAAMLPWEYAMRIVRPYQSIAMSLLGRGIMLQRSHGGLRLKKSRFDPRIGAERIQIGRHKKYFTDPHDFMSTFRGYPFGLAHEDRGVIVDARTCYFGRRCRELIENGRFENQRGHVKAFFSVPDGVRELVNIADIKPIVQGSATPGLADRVDTYAEKGQSGFDSAQLIQQMPFLIALGVGFGLMWFAKELGGSASTPGDVIPIMIGVMPF